MCVSDLFLMEADGRAFTHSVGPEFFRDLEGTLDSYLEIVSKDLAQLWTKYYAAD